MTKTNNMRGSVLKYLGTIAAALLVLCVLAGLAPVVGAAGKPIASGTIGTCSWEITENSVLVVAPLNGPSGGIALSSSGQSAPWDDYLGIGLDITILAALAGLMAMIVEHRKSKSKETA